MHADGILRFTDPTRTVLDPARDGYPVEQLQLVYELALSRGLVRRRALTTDSERLAAYLDRVPAAAIRA